MRKPVFCIVADQLFGYCAADQHLCLRHIDGTIPLLPKFEISSLWPSSLILQPGLCQTLSETRKTGFLITWLTCFFPMYRGWRVRISSHPAQQNSGTYSISQLHQRICRLVNIRILDECEVLIEKSVQRVTV